MLVLLFSSVLLLSPTLWCREVSEEARVKCINGVRDSYHRCYEFANIHVEHGEEHEHGYRVKRAEDGMPDPNDYPRISRDCLTVNWENATASNNWGNCMNMTLDDTYRYITSNMVPDFYYNSYCPIGLGLGYCIQQEIDAGLCFFTNLTCGEEGNGPGTNAYGDVWVPLQSHFKIPLAGNPTRSDRPGGMYDADSVGAKKTMGPAAGVAINGIGILGPNDAGAVSIDDAGFQLACGGHVSPPLANNKTSLSKDGPQPSPPFYHFHKATDCLEPFKSASIGVASGAKPYEHGKVTGWALDGFSIYTYQDINGTAPVVDECGGHFGPVDDSGAVEYHYHARVIVPYHMACQGPSLGKCAGTQTTATSFCHPGCGFDVCVQPGTSKAELEKYLDKFNDTWLEKYTVNDYSGAVAAQLSLACLLIGAFLNLVI